MYEKYSDFTAFCNCWLRIFVSTHRVFIFWIPGLVISCRIGLFPSEVEEYACSYEEEGEKHDSDNSNKGGSANPSTINHRAILGSCLVFGNLHVCCQYESGQVWLKQRSFSSVISHSLSSMRAFNSFFPSFLQLQSVSGEL